VFLVAAGLHRLQHARAILGSWFWLSELASTRSTAIQKATMPPFMPSRQASSSRPLAAIVGPAVDQRLHLRSRCRAPADVP
jgi:hypothetical protein